MNLFTCLSIHKITGVWFIAVLLLVHVCLAKAKPPVRDERPNIVLLVSEDNSVHFMQHFHATGARMPNIESLAARGITFDRAFSNAPVCSAARTAVITGVHGPRIVTQHHRPVRHAHLPEGWHMFPHYLREAGYFTVKNGKKDFNMIEGDVWDEDGNQAHWRSRPDENIPFFYMEQTGNDTHEGRLHFNSSTFENEPTVHNPQNIDLFAYLPDTDLMRYTHAYYLDRHLELDEKVGEVIEDLEKDGLLEQTIVIYYGDHGGALPRSKGTLYEGGLHVPMVVYIPDRFRHLSPFDAGSRVEGFIEFVDIGPTVLNLAGVGLPAHMDGMPFLGPDITASQVEDREQTFSYVDRLDEKYDMIRALRKGDFKYIRNYWAHYPDALRNNYRFTQLAYQQWHELYERGELSEVQRAFFEARTPEALYDLRSDPHETVNLAQDPAYADVLAEMRGLLRLRMRSMPDLGVFPESYLAEHAAQNPLAFAQKNTTRITRLLDVADLALLPFEEAEQELREALRSNDPWVLYWALTAACVFGEQAAGLQSYALELASDGTVPIRVRASELLGLLQAGDPVSVLYDAVSEATNQADVLLALNTMTYLRDHLGYRIDTNRIEPNVRSNQINWRMQHLSR